MHNYLEPDDKEKNNITHLAKANRGNQTEAEGKMWRLLRGRRFAEFKFRRQHQLLRYLVDFVCIEKRLVIELDGGQHNDPDKVAQDRSRTEELGNLGFRVLRFWNHDVFCEADMVREMIYRALKGERDA